jgi:hypothetical protein
VAQTFSWRWLQGRAAEYIPVFEALSVSEPAELTWPAVTAWCLAEAGARDRAAGLLHRMKPASAVAADHWLGVLAGVAGRFTEAVQHLEAGLTRHRDMGSWPLTALTQEAYGHVLSRRGEEADIERARMLTGAAMRTADEFGLAAIRNRPHLRR